MKPQYLSTWSVLGVLGLAACGVAEHPHGIAPVDTSHDFGGPAGGAASDFGGAPPVGGAPAGGAPSTFGGAPPAGGAPTTGGAPATGGAPGAGAGGAPAAAGAPGAAGGAAVTTISLGGTNVPVDHAIAFIHIGHSNMAGRASSPAASKAYHFTETDPHAFMYHVAANGGGGMPGPPALAIEPKTAGDQLGTAGPGTSLLKQAAALAPNYYFVSLGFAVPSAYCSQFLPGALYYDQLIAAPKAIKGKVTFGAIFIYLGITERHGTAADISGYPNCINTLVTNIRKDVGVPDLPLIINDYEVEATGDLAVGKAEANAIMPQIAKIPTTVQNSVLVPCDKLGMQDDHHFNLDGQKEWARRALALMQTKGWFPWK